MLTRSYSRVKPKEVLDLMPRFQRRMYNNAPANAKKFWMQAMQKASTMMGGYFPDIFNVLGSDNGYLFIRTSSRSLKDFHLDIISPDTKLVSRIEIGGDEVTSSTLQNGHVLINRTNEDDGPYVEVYAVQIN